MAGSACLPWHTRINEQQRVRCTFSYPKSCQIHEAQFYVTQLIQTKAVYTKPVSRCTGMPWKGRQKVGSLLPPLEGLPSGKSVLLQERYLLPITHYLQFCKRFLFLAIVEGQKPKRFESHKLTFLQWILLCPGQIRPKSNLGVLTVSGKNYIKSEIAYGQSIGFRTSPETKAWFMSSNSPRPMSKFSIVLYSYTKD